MRRVMEMEDIFNRSKNRTDAFKCNGLDFSMWFDLDAPHKEDDEVYEEVTSDE